MKSNAFRESLRLRSQDVPAHPLPLPLQEVVLLALADLLPHAPQKRREYWQRVYHDVSWGTRTVDIKTLLSNPSFPGGPSVADAAKQRAEKTLELARQNRRPGRPVSIAQMIRDDDRYYLHFHDGLSFREIAWLQRRVGQQHIVSTAINEVLARRPQPLSIAPGAESSVRDSVNRVLKREKPDAPAHRARRRRLEPLPADLAGYDCPEHDRGCGPRCRYLLAWKSQVEPFLPTDRSGG